jgi:hypothetical protein
MTPVHPIAAKRRFTWRQGTVIFFINRVCARDREAVPAVLGQELHESCFARYGRLYWIGERCSPASVPRGL